MAYITFVAIVFAGFSWINESLGKYLESIAAVLDL